MPLTDSSHRSAWKPLRLLALLAVVALASTACLDDLTPSGGWSAPVHENDWLYVTSKDGHLVRVSAETGSQDKGWMFPPVDEDLGVGYGQPLVRDDAVFAAVYNCRGNDCSAHVFGVDRETAAPLWGERTFSLPTEVVGSVAVHEDTLVFGTSRLAEEEDRSASDAGARGYLYAIDATPDAKRALNERIPQRLKWRFPVRGKIWSSPAVHEGVAYFGTGGRAIYSVDLSDDLGPDPESRERWRFATGGAVMASPVITDGKLYVGDFEGNFYSLDLDARPADPEGHRLDPAREWRFDVGAWVWAPPVVDGDVLYVGTLDGEVFALDRGTGKPLWAGPANVGGQIVASPVMMDVRGRKTLAIPSGDEDVWIVDVATGDVDGKFSTDTGVKARPVVIGNFIYVHTLDQQLKWFSINDRTLRGCVEIPSGQSCL